MGFYDTNKGFTLFEILLVTGIGIILGALVFVSITKLNAEQDLELAASSVVSFVRGAQQRAISQESNTTWGVWFNNASSGPDSYMLFSGLPFGSATSTALLPVAVEFSDPSSGNGKFVLFQNIKGIPTTTVSVTMRLISDVTKTRTITISTNGSISY